MTDQESPFAYEVAIVKAEEAKNRVFGVALVSKTADGEDVWDQESDGIELGELEDAAYLFALNFGDAGVGHVGKTEGKLIESMVFTPEKLEKLGLPRDALPQAWWVGFQLEGDSAPETFAQVRAGVLKAFSIEGIAVRELVTTET